MKINISGIFNVVEEVVQDVSLFEQVLQYKQQVAALGQTSQQLIENLAQGKVSAPITPVTSTSSSNVIG